MSLFRPAAHWRELELICVTFSAPAFFGPSRTFATIRVYAGRDAGGAPVALKLLDYEHVAANPRLVKQVQLEISTMLCVQHPNVLRIHNMIEDTVFNHRRWIMLVLELAPKKEIFDFIGMRDSFLFLCVCLCRAARRSESALRCVARLFECVCA